MRKAYDFVGKSQGSILLKQSRYTWADFEEEGVEVWSQLL
jgi:hypothetical protein